MLASLWVTMCPSIFSSLLRWAVGTVTFIWELINPTRAVMLTLGRSCRELFRHLATRPKVALELHRKNLSKHWGTTTADGTEPHTEPTTPSRSMALEESAIAVVLLCCPGTPSRNPQSGSCFNRRRPKRSSSSCSGEPDPSRLAAACGTQVAGGRGLSGA